jgi:hypothetical protein
LLIIFEDLNWVDHSTVDLISALARRHAPARLMLVGTYRPVDVAISGHPLMRSSRICSFISCAMRLPGAAWRKPSGRISCSRFPRNRSAKRPG